MKKAKNNFRLFTHHSVFLNVNLGSKPDAKKLGGLFLKILLLPVFLFEIFVEICYQTGSVLVSYAKKISIEASKTLSNLPLRAKAFGSPKTKVSIGIFLLLTMAVFAVLQTQDLLAWGLKLKEKVVWSAFLGGNYLLSAKESLSRQDVAEAQNRFALAFKTFADGKRQLDEAGVLFDSFSKLIPQKQDAERLLEASRLAAGAGSDLVDLQKLLNSAKLSPSGLASTEKPNHELLNDISASLANADKKIASAYSLITAISPRTIPGAQTSNFIELKNKLAILHVSLSNTKEVFDIFSGMVYGDKNILLLFENNNELRPSGGFIGTFGNLKISDGKITSMKVSSIYDLDGQLDENILPPNPLLNVNNRWYMRDSNWFADFPESAKIISSFYEKEGGETPDVIVAITPNLLVDLLKITGPIALPGYHVTLSSENFIEKIQQFTTTSSDAPTNSPKQILADLFPIILQKLSSSESQKWLDFIQIFQDNLNSKQIIFYSRDSSLQNKISDFNWDGGIRPSDRDYLAVISANLGGTKTDLDIKQRVDLQTKVGNDGRIINELTITRQNTLPKLPYTQNLSFVRIMVPKGAKLLSNSGFDQVELPSPGSRQDFSQNDAVRSWENSVVKDLTSGTMIGEESGKTFFGNWVNLEGGETKTVKLQYELPFKLANTDRYSLLWQKQAGSIGQDVNWHIDYTGWNIVWKNFESGGKSEPVLEYKNSSNQDFFLGIVFKKGKR